MRPPRLAATHLMDYNADKINQTKEYLNTTCARYVIGGQTGKWKCILYFDKRSSDDLRFVSISIWMLTACTTLYCTCAVALMSNSRRWRDPCPMTNTNSTVNKTHCYNKSITGVTWNNNILVGGWNRVVSNSWVNK